MIDCVLIQDVMCVMLRDLVLYLMTDVLENKGNLGMLNFCTEQVVVVVFQLTIGEMIPPVTRSKFKRSNGAAGKLTCSRLRITMLGLS